jgi:hypothetical protein
LGYRYVFRNQYPGDKSHPRSLFVAESRILSVLDEWLRKLCSKNVRTTEGEMTEHPDLDDRQRPEVRRARIMARPGSNQT